MPNTERSARAKGHHQQQQQRFSDAPQACSSRDDVCREYNSSREKWAYVVFGEPSQMLPTPPSSSLVLHMHSGRAPAGRPSLAPSSSTTTINSTLELGHSPSLDLAMLPTELIDQVIRSVPLNTLPAIMRVSSRFHALAERHLYNRLEPQLLPSDHQHQRGWQCLQTIVSRPSAAAAVRFFKARGLPWMEDAQISLLSRAFQAMLNLVYFDFDLDESLERSLFETFSPSLFPDIKIINVHDPLTIKALCAPSSSNGTRPIHTARIASPIDENTAHVVIPALANSSGPLRQLQLSVQLSDLSELFDILSLLARTLTSLETFGIDIRLSKPLCVDQYNPTIESISNILRHLDTLTKLSLVLFCHKQQADPCDVELLSQACPSLRHIELQWSAWRQTDNTSRWEKFTPRTKLMRQEFKYP